MVTRGRRLGLMLAGVVFLLFAGRWAAGLFADRWWAVSIAPAAGQFLTERHVLRLTLDVGAVLLAAAWFIGHLFVVHRAIGSVQVPRQVANLEIREALTPETLLFGATVTGALLGLFVGAGASDWWETVALAWHGVRYGISDPILQHDLGFYVAQLPLWRLLHGFALLLTLLACGLVATLYVAVGSMRWMGGRLALSDHSRFHLGWLLVALGGCLVWGYCLEPYEILGGVHGVPDAGALQLEIRIARLLAIVASGATLASALWALRARHALAAGAWALLGAVSLTGHFVLPPLFARPDLLPAEPAYLRDLDRQAYGLAVLTDTTLASFATPPTAGGPPSPSGLWHDRVVVRLAEGDSVDVVAASQAVLTGRGLLRPVWLVVRARPGGGTGLVAYADDRVTPGGGAVAYRIDDTLGYPGTVPFAEFAVPTVRPGAPDHALLGADRPGVRLGAWGQRLLLAWACQAGEILTPAAAGARLAWRLTPDQRLGALAPFARWGRPEARVIDGELVWIADGYLAAEAFPLSSRVEWGGASLGSIRASFLGVIHASSGATAVYLRGGDDPMARAWAELVRGVVQEAEAMPPALRSAAGYPRVLFQAQARVLEGPVWSAGRLSDALDSASLEGVREVGAWVPDGTGTRLVTAFGHPGERRLSALLIGLVGTVGDELRLLRFDSTLHVPDAANRTTQWGRFASFAELQDSIRSAGDSLDAGPVRFWLDASGVGAYQARFALRGTRSPRLVWVSIAKGDRLGAGRTLREAWDNLQGGSAPLVPTAGSPDRFGEARRWAQRADSALRRGDWSGFGRAFDALKQVLEAGPEGPK